MSMTIIPSSASSLSISKVRCLPILTAMPSSAVVSIFSTDPGKSPWYASSNCMVAFSQTVYTWLTLILPSVKTSIGNLLASGILIVVVVAVYV